MSWMHLAAHPKLWIIARTDDHVHDLVFNFFYGREALGRGVTQRGRLWTLLF